MISKLRKAVKFPEAAKREVTAAITRPFITESFATESHVNRDWDNLLILDACRYDTFVEQSPFESVERVRTNASHTTGFLSRNLTGNQYDTIYVSASPQIVGHESRFHAVVHAWQDAWDEEFRTVLPEDVTELALKALKTHPHKRLVVHYMQPHYPFIGPTGQELKTHATFTGGLREREYLSVWEQASAGDIPVEKVRRAYQENLQLVLDEVYNLIKELDGKTIITSDHGNLFGEKLSPLPLKIYGHPPNFSALDLIKVPLVELSDGARRQITTEDSETINQDSEDLEERLKDLGYL